MSSNKQTPCKEETNYFTQIGEIYFGKRKEKEESPIYLPIQKKE